MKIPRIANAINHIDDELVSGALSTRTAKKNAWLKWASVAACFVIFLVAVAAVALNLLDAQNPITQTDKYTEKYYDYWIDAGEFAEYIGGKVVSEDKIGSKISDVSVTAGWKNGAGEWLSMENLNAEVYEIEGVERDVSVALKFIDKGEALTTTHYYEIKHPNAEYNGMKLPDYKAENPVRYLEEGDMGRSNGWQDFGPVGEIRTITVPIGSTYIYQMYSYYIRNDLTHLYSNWTLPSSLEELPEWLADTEAVGRKSFWYSMGYRLPANIAVENVTEITSEDGNINFIAAEYKIQLRDGENEKEESWIIYFMQEYGVYSAYAVVAHENFDFVKSYSESIVKSYQIKQN